MVKLATHSGLGREFRIHRYNFYPKEKQRNKSSAPSFSSEISVGMREMGLMVD
jgi:hypothetical protein